MSVVITQGETLEKTVAPSVSNSSLLNEQITTGKYFDIAKQWYADKYLAPYSAVFYVLVLLLIFVYASYVTVRIATAEYNNQKVAFPVYVSDADSVDNYSKMTGLPYGKDNINFSFAVYFLKFYVLLRESYTPNLIEKINLDSLRSRIHNLSSAKVSNEFENFISLQNQESPIVKYRNFVTRDITITSINLNRFDREKVNGATVEFTATERGASINQTSNWIADVVFNLNDIYQVHQKKKPLKFLVFKYSVQKIETPKNENNL